MVQHTPGPWHPANATSELRVDALNGATVAWAIGPFTTERHAERNANAALISAAPEMAGVLGAVRHEMQCACSPGERDSGHLVGCWLPTTLAMIDNVLAKAVGAAS